ncbi:hypothetical protein HJG53_05355 [Sphingomonas sp. ID1715]|uniref:hypothetical protein n=1 Tax=Sphingomonas sp. ID1715 TaxID=1656898 RepID=UPI0014898FAD|nr:hypothetical protein [Sphingomonas sp. ID1715]NNM76329.1 hypothetical protein [Sphingomonas sp. ID1715]
MVDEIGYCASRSNFAHFDSHLECLQWTMLHRNSLSRNLPGAKVRPVRLDR